MDLVNPVVRRWLEEAGERPDAYCARMAGALHLSRQRAGGAGDAGRPGAP